MAILKVKEIREMSVQQIDEKIVQLRTDYAKMMSQKRSGGAPENSGKMRTIRKAIARLMTIKSQKERGESPVAKEVPVAKKADAKPAAKAESKPKTVKAAPKKTAAKK
jgi:large subunit ribosomal protein L29